MINFWSFIYKDALWSKNKLTLVILMNLSEILNPIRKWWQNFPQPIQPIGAVEGSAKCIFQLWRHVKDIVISCEKPAMQQNLTFNPILVGPFVPPILPPLWKWAQK